MLRADLDSGYLWSPIVGADDRKNQTDNFPLG